MQIRGESYQKLCTLSGLVGALTLGSLACSDDDTQRNGSRVADSQVLADSGVDGPVADASLPPVRPNNLTACTTSSADKVADIDKITTAADDERLTELSGIAASRRNAGVLWVHDDSGNDPNIYAINESGQLLAGYRLQGVALRDWEDIAIGPGPEVGTDYLYVGDIGSKNRTGLGSDIVIYRVEEPTVSSTPPSTFEIVDLGTFAALPANYPAGPERDANSLFVDPADSRDPDIFIVTSGDAVIPNSVFRLSGATAAVAVELVHVTDVYGGAPLDEAVFAADISADGSQIIMRSTQSANLWQRTSGQSIADALAGTPCDAPIVAADASSGEGGAIGFSATGDAYFTTIEADPPPLFKVVLGAGS